NTPVDLVFQGTSRIDVWQISAFLRGGTGRSTLDTIANTTPGDIVNVEAQAVGDISGNTIGLASSNVGADKLHQGNAVNARDLVTFNDTGGPWVDQRNAINLGGT